MADEPVPGGFQVPAVWVGMEEVPIQLANAFLGQVERQEIILSIGQVTPPVLTGTTPEALEAQAQQVRFVPVRVAARLALTRTRLEELMATLQTTLENYDKMQEVLRAQGWPT